MTARQARSAGLCFSPQRSHPFVSVPTFMASLPVSTVLILLHGTTRQHGAPLCTFGSEDASFCFPDCSGFVIPISSFCPCFCLPACIRCFLILTTGSLRAWATRSQLARSSLCTSALLLQVQSIHPRISWWKETFNPYATGLGRTINQHQPSQLHTRHAPIPAKLSPVISRISLGQTEETWRELKRGLSKCRLLPTDGCRRRVGLIFWQAPTILSHSTLQIIRSRSLQGGSSLLAKSILYGNFCTLIST